MPSDTKEKEKKSSRQEGQFQKMSHGKSNKSKKRGIEGGSPTSMALLKTDCVAPSPIKQHKKLPGSPATASSKSSEMSDLR